MEEIMSNIAGTTILVIIVVYLIMGLTKLMGLAKRNNTRSLWEFKLVDPGKLKIIEKDDIFYYNGTECKVTGIYHELCTGEYMIEYIMLHDGIICTATLEKLHDDKCDIFICNK